MKLLWIILAVVTLLIGAAAIFVYRTLSDLGRPPTPPLPSLLAGAAGVGGKRAWCTDGEAALRDQPQSPEIAERLRWQAPPGSSADTLAKTLQQQGFEVDERPCVNLPGVRHALFRQQPGGGLTYAARAEVWWGVDDAGRVAWTSGYIFYTGL